MTKAFTIDPRETRRIATRMGIPESTLLPPVQVENRNEAGLVPLTRAGTREYPSGYTILIPSKNLKQSEGGWYTLGSEAIDDIRHELYHYIQRKRRPTTRRREIMSTDMLLKWEIDAELKSGLTKRSPSVSIAVVIDGVAEEREISHRALMDRVWKIGKRDGISDAILLNTEKALFNSNRLTEVRGDPARRAKGTLSDEMDKPGKRTPTKDETTVKEHGRRTRKGGTTVRKHRRVLKRR